VSGRGKIMHPKTDELLALRDGDGEPEVGRHVADCPACTGELERLRTLQRAMRRLPDIPPPEGSWARLRAAARRQRRLREWRIGFVAAAAVIAAGWIGVFVVNLGPNEPVPTAVARASEDRALVDLIAASGELESVLQAPALRSPVLSPTEAALIVSLEDRIAVIDLQLAATGGKASHDRDAALWSNRVELLDELVRARGGSPDVTGIQRAVYTEERR
jgi:anti-sigma factor RsiW